MNNALARNFEMIYQGQKRDGSSICLFHDKGKSKYVLAKVVGAMRLPFEEIAESLGFGEAYRRYNAAFA